LEEKRPGGETSWRRNVLEEKRPGGETTEEKRRRRNGRGETAEEKRDAPVGYNIFERDLKLLFIKKKM
jgi:hypothetical protein